MSKLKALLFKLAKVVGTVVAVVIALWVYSTFIAREPVFGPEQDIELGQQSVMAIEEAPSEFPILSSEEYPEAYAHMYRIMDEVLASPDIEYKDLFDYSDVQIIHDDEVLNAFCTPGGFIYVYTGLIKYLDAEDHLAGVLGHEIAHAERRHSSLRLQAQYGAEQLFNFIILTTPISARAAWALSILTDLTELGYSREQEAESDEWSVRYLAGTDYACDGAAGFFAKLLAEGDNEGERPPEFLSDHPEPAARIANIQRQVQELGCDTASGDQSQWVDFQSSLP